MEVVFRAGRIRPDGAYEGTIHLTADWRKTEETVILDVAGSRSLFNSAALSAMSTVEMWYDEAIRLTDEVLERVAKTKRTE